MENRPTIPNRTGFADLMRPGERIAALVYLPIHVFALPLLLPYLVYAVPDITAVDINLTYYVIGFVYMLALCWRFLRAGFDAALDRLGTFVLAILTAYLLEMALSMVISSLIVALNLGLGSSPNNDAFVSMIPEGRSKIIAMTVFMAPIVEEVLFRGARIRRPAAQEPRPRLGGERAGLLPVPRLAVCGGGPERGHAALRPALYPRIHELQLVL